MKMQIVIRVRFLENTTCVLKAVKKKVLGFASEIQEVPFNLVKTEGT